MKIENSKLKIVLAPSPILSEKSETVGKIDSSILKVIQDLKKALDSAHDPIGVGLAAPQIGKSLRIFIAKPSEKSEIQVFINPQIRSEKSTIKKRAKKGPSKLEGCLSLPDIWGEVLRNEEINLSFMDTKGKKRKRKFKGLMSTIVQHEVNHLDGTLFPRSVLEQKGKLYRSHKNKKGEDVFDKIELL